MEKAFTHQLIKWYTAHKRDLPWRKSDGHTPGAYEIWLSEIMLQQTQVATVLDYYRKFLKLFPTVQHLAKADLDTVLKAWEGLGYYARCRNLHKTAQIVSEQYQGRFPDTIEEMQALPGIGQSTAGAILTFAYNQRQPILDGNVKRVLSRVYAVTDNIAKPDVIKRMWGYSNNLINAAGDPYSFNQAIMELGATLCIPKEPRCLVCPLSNLCKAKAKGIAHELPVKTKKAPTPHYDIAVGVVWKSGKILIQQRPNEGLLGGLWEFPGGKQEPKETLEETVGREIAEELEIEITVGEKIATVKHAYTHFKITLHAYHCNWKSGKPEPKAAQAWLWVQPEELSKYAFPKANKTVLETLLKELPALKA